jgi:dTDP-4-amino-4,6-dideoxygalactose transaminase
MSRLARYVRQMRRSRYDVPWCVPAWGWNELRACLGRTVAGRVVRGQDAERFAAAVAQNLGRRFGVPVNRGRTAIQIGLRALGVQPGDDVVVSTYVCRTAVDGILAAGAQPVFADVSNDLHLTLATVRAAVTASTRCIVVPHLFGGTAPVDAIERFARDAGIELLDDAAQSFGARRAGRPVGSFGRGGIVAVGAGKSLAGAAGGVFVTDDADVGRRARQMVESLPEESAPVAVGRVAQYWMWRRLRRQSLPIRMVLDRYAAGSEEPHIASRLSNLDAAIGREQLALLHENARIRRLHSERFARALGSAKEYIVSEMGESGTHVKIALVLPEGGADSETLIEMLSTAGIEAQRGYRPCHLDVAPRVALPVAEALWERVVCLPTETAPSAATLRRLALGIREVLPAQQAMCIA